MNKKPFTPKKPVASRGRIMDFTPRRTPNSGTPTRRTIQRSHKTPSVTTQETIVVKRTTPVRPKRPTSVETATVATAIAAMEYQKQLEGQQVRTTITETEYGVIEDHEPIRISEKPVEEQKSAPEAPNASQHVLGGKSPFINTEVEKRPLNASPHHIAVTTPPPVAKNTVHNKAKSSTTKKHSSVVTPKRKKSKVPFILLIISTVILGGSVGAIVYFLFFSNM